MTTDTIRDWLTQTLPAADVSCLTLTPLAAEASFRRFYRVELAGSTWVVMDSPPERENNEQFCRLAEVFGAAGLGVPQILARDDPHGWYLLTDLGSRDLEAAYHTDDKNAAVQAAIDALVCLQGVTHSAISTYSPERFATELEIFSHWFAGNILQISLPAWLEDVFETLVAVTQAQNQCCVHRDYHCRNLLFDEQGNFGIVDFQDALNGPVSYDLASLLHDCYYRFEPDEIDRWCAYYLRKTPLQLDPRGFRCDLDYCAVQRQLKAVGIFSRLHLRDGKSSHLPHIEPVLENLVMLCSAYPELGELGSWLQSLIPHTREVLGRWRR